MIESPEPVQSAEKPGEQLAVLETRALFLPHEQFPVLREELEAMRPDIEAEIALANGQTVTNLEQAEFAGVILSKLDDRQKLIEGKVKPFTQIAFKLHRWLTSYNGEWTSPLETARRSLKGRVIAWQVEQERKAEKERQRLQAEADRKAQGVRDRIQREIDRKNAEAQAAKRTETHEKKLQQVEELREQQAAVAAPVVNVEPPKASTVRTSKRWQAQVEDLATFLEAALKEPTLRGYIEVDTTKLARGKSANTALLAPGIKFYQVTV